jgi:hypothetical protein
MSQAMRKVKFMSVARIEGLMFNPAEPRGFRLHRSGPRALTATLTPVDPKDDPFGHRRGLEAKLMRSHQIEGWLFHFVDKLNAGVFTSYPDMTIKLPYMGGRGKLIARDGTLSEGYSLSWKHYPADWKAICDNVFAELSQDTSKFVKQLMWFFNISHVHDPVQYIFLYCNTRGAEYHAVKLPSEPSTYWHNDVVWDNANRAAFISLWKSASEEPLGHELFREAGSLLHSAPRSALLMLANALEFAVKSYISQRVPATQWLLTEVQSPPISKMLRRFVPTLKPARGVDLSNWDALSKIFNRFDDLTTQRNHLAHRGTWELKIDKLIEFKDDVSDVLFILDYLSGQQWAINNVRKETCRTLKWPDPIGTQKQIRATLRVVDE